MMAAAFMYLAMALTLTAPARLAFGRQLPLNGSAVVLLQTQAKMDSDAPLQLLAKLHLAETAPAGEEPAEKSPEEELLTQLEEDDENGVMHQPPQRVMTIITEEELRQRFPDKSIQRLMLLGLVEVQANSSRSGQLEYSAPRQSAWEYMLSRAQQRREAEKLRNKPDVKENSTEMGDSKAHVSENKTQEDKNENIKDIHQVGEGEDAVNPNTFAEVPQGGTSSAPTKPLGVFWKTVSGLYTEAGKKSELQEKHTEGDENNTGSRTAVGSAVKEVKELAGVVLRRFKSGMGKDTRVADDAPQADEQSPDEQQQNHADDAVLLEKDHEQTSWAAGNRLVGWFRDWLHE